MEKDFSLKAYTYHLPSDQIAQQPVDRRDQSRLLVLNNTDGTISHRNFSNIVEYIDNRDLLVVNDTRVFPARLFGHKDSGGKAEVFLLGYPLPTATAGEASAEALIKSSKRPRPGTTITIDPSLVCTVEELLPAGRARLTLHYTGELDRVLAGCGQVPLPPYIHRSAGTSAEDLLRYQTVYASQPGAVAAPTAGLHFTRELLEQLTRRGVLLGHITLHVGYGTFAPVRVEQIAEHRIHKEYVRVPAETVAGIAAARKRGGRIWAVGTTTVRALEFAARGGALRPVADWCDLYIYPGYGFKVIDNLITNFHLPGSSLMFLVAALCGRERLLDCYRQAVDEGYRFYSYGDAMAVIGHRP
ncbi:MAG: tRNA preQ1(34) S-adenosylmethionine ribosyltransferase-isomerase QueA [Desulfopila sp.]